MLFAVVFNVWGYNAEAAPYGPLVRGVGYILIFALFATLGWQVFGSAVK
jgi:cytochrome b